MRCYFSKSRQNTGTGLCLLHRNHQYYNQKNQIERGGNKTTLNTTFNGQVPSSSMHKSDNFRTKLPQPHLVWLSSRLALCSCTVISLPPACPGTSYLCHPVLIQSRLCSAQYMWWVPCKWAAAQHLLFFYLQSSLCGPKPCLQVAFLLLLCVQNRSLLPNPLCSSVCMYYTALGPFLCITLRWSPTWKATLPVLHRVQQGRAKLK